MRIESARALKQEIKSGYLSRLGTEDSDRQRLGVRAHISEGPARPRTIALGITARKSGPDDHKLAVRVQHPLLWNREEVDKIRRQAAGEVDVRYIGQVRPLRASASQGKCRPLCLGCSIGHFQITAGSLGAFVQDRATQAIQILSNNHVLAAENLGKPGDDILQPGAFDKGQDPRDAVAQLSNFIPINFGGDGTVDCAVAAIGDGIRYDVQSLGSRGKLAGGRVDPLIQQETVYKIGRSTDVTSGAISAIEVDNINVTYDRGAALFDSQIEVAPPAVAPSNVTFFAMDGDSGSLVFDENNLALGLVFGGTLQDGPGGPGYVYVNQLDLVLNQLNVDLLW